MFNGDSLPRLFKLLRSNENNGSQVARPIFIHVLGNFKETLPKNELAYLKKNVHMVLG